MIKTHSYLNVADNTGARELMCIRVVISRRGNLGSTFIAVVKESLPNMPLQRSEVVRGVVVRTYQEIQRINGSLIRFDDNAAVLINKDGNPLGSRVSGPVARELRVRKFSKIMSLSEEVL